MLDNLFKHLNSDKIKIVERYHASEIINTNNA
jgi:hypothetical protein